MESEYGWLKLPCNQCMDYFGIEQEQATKRENTRYELDACKHDYIDNQYFGDVDNLTASSHSKFTNQSGERSIIDDDLGEIDAQYFGQSAVQTSVDEKSVHSDDIDVGEDHYIDHQYFGKEKRDAEPKFSKLPPRRRMSNSSDGSQLRIGDIVHSIRQKTRLNLYTGRILEPPFSNNRTTDNGDRLDSKGRRVPDDDPIKFHLLSEEEAANALIPSIHAIHEDIIILNKAYGIPSHAGPGHKHSIASLLPRLEHYIRHKMQQATADPCEFFITHRLDRESTGLMLIARNRDASLSLQEAFAKRWIRKCYLCVTVGIPEGECGNVALPLVEKEFSGIHKMCVVPLKRHNHPKESGPIDAMNSTSRGTSDGSVQSSRIPSTDFKLLSRRNGAALLLCSALTGFKHQVRVHLAMGLQTPILGDHKYSHATYLAPQRLPRQLLDCLDIRQSKVRYLPLHLHAVELKLANSCPLDNRVLRVLSSQHNSKIIVPPTNFFMKNLNRIGLTLPRYLLKAFHP